MGILNGILVFALIVASLSLIGLILIQHGKGGGLAGAFGGGGVEQAFGTRATTLAQKATVVLGSIYLLLSIMLGIRLTPGTSVTPARQPSRTTAPATAPPATAPATPPATAPAAKQTAPSSQGAR